MSALRSDPRPWRLTVKLRGRAQAPDWSRGCTLFSRTRGDTTDSHGPLQRLLEVAFTMPCGAVVAAIVAPRVDQDCKLRRPRLVAAWAAHPVYAKDQKIHHTPNPRQEEQGQDRERGPPW